MAESKASPGLQKQLLLLASEQQVYAFDLSKQVRVTIGRHDSNDLQLPSRTVSNFHAEIVKENHQLVLRDLGSTNGTRVNDERVERKSLGRGDRIRIGNHSLTLQLKPLDGAKDGFIRYQRHGSFGPGARGGVISMRLRTADAAKTLQTDDPNDLLLPDLLKLVAACPDPAVVVLTRNDETARVYAIKQRLVHAEYDKVVGEKALYRLFSWQGARYEVKEVSNPVPVPRSIGLPTETLLMEGMQHAVELGKVVAQLPPLEVPLRLKEDCPLPLTAHSPAEIEIFQEIIRHGTIARVLEQSPLTDLRVLRLIESLVRKGVFEVFKSSETLIEETFVSRDGRLPG